MALSVLMKRRGQVDDRVWRATPFSESSKKVWTDSQRQRLSQQHQQRGRHRREPRRRRSNRVLSSGVQTGSTSIRALQVQPTALLGI